MQTCWYANPSERPGFDGVVSMINKIAGKMGCIFLCLIIFEFFYRGCQEEINIINKTPFSYCQIKREITQKLKMNLNIPERMKTM